MDVEEEIIIVGDISNPPVSHNSGLLNCDSQWLLDRPFTKPSSWYIDSLYKTLDKTQEECPESVGHITSENSISDESGWTGKEKNLLERGIEIFGKSIMKLSQFIGSKSPSEIKYYLETFYIELHPLHSAKYAMPKVDEGNDVLETVVINSEIPCTSELISQKTSSANCQEDEDVNLKNVSIKVKMKSNAQKQCRAGKLNVIYNNVKDVTVKTKNTLSKIKFVETELSSLNNVLPIRTGILLNEGEEIININKKLSETSDSDIEVDVEDNDELNINDKIVEKCQFSKSSHDQNRNTEENGVENLTHNNVETVCIPTETINYLRDVSNDVKLPEANQELMDQLSSLNIPKNELKLRMDLILDLEKVFNRDFFSVSRRSFTSPELYLRLRHEIISKWMKRKPHYVSKTDVGKNLNVSINKNTLNRIHNCLEQIGAINFGCSRVRYVRPLYKLLKSAEIPSQMKSIKPRRHKKKFLHNGQGGCTVSHGDHGEIINTTIVNEDPAPVKTKIARKQPIYLIYCKSFTQDYEYSVKLHISTLLLMDFHAHSSTSEVMGLIGGTWCAQTKTLLISHYEPCKNVASSTTHCDMCPVSQANSAEIIHSKNMDLLGWFHSHPTFAPEPSQQDLDTQKALQEWIGRGKPCVGVILSPFNKPQVLSPSEYRCMIVEKLHGDDVYLPYKFKVDIQCANFDIDEFLRNVLKIFHFNSSSDLESDRQTEIIFKKPYLYDANITYFDKFISSTKMTLEKYISNETICQRIICGIKQVCTNEKRL